MFRKVDFELRKVTIIRSSSELLETPSLKLNESIKSENISVEDVPFWSLNQKDFLYLNLNTFLTIFKITI
jgi:hypothetical protein